MTQRKQKEARSSGGGSSQGSRSQDGAAEDASQQGKQSSSSHEQQNQSQSDQAPTPLPEKIVGAIGLLLVLATIGYLIYQGVLSDGPPEIVVEVTDVVKHETGYLALITVTNNGGQTAEGLVVVGELLPVSAQDGQNNQQSRPQPVESATISFPFVPPNSQRQGGLIFDHNPLAYDLQVSANGYTRP